jgi:LPS-assembly lipoprotein
MKHLFAATALTLSLTLSACAGFQPMHGTQGAQTAFSDMSVIMGEGENEGDRAAGYLIRQRLADRMSKNEKPTYQVIIKPSVRQIGLGLSGQDFATRFDRLVGANWTLTRAKDGQVMARGSAGSTATYSADRDPYRLLSTADEATKRAARAVADELLSDIALEIAALPTP